MDEHLGTKFWLQVLGICLAAGIGAMLLFTLLGAAWYTWGALGTLILVGALLLLWGYMYDRAHSKARY